MVYIQQQDITYRLANYSDCKDVYTWENDSITRANSKNIDQFSYSSHAAWFKKSLINDKRFLYIAIKSVQRVALIRFDQLEQGVYESSLILNPIIRGKGISSQILQGGMSLFLEGRYGAATLKASIKNTNLASKKCFSKCGFILNHVDDEYSYYNYF
jgi:RimJ/RimL family protein N-acetyltransferase